MTVRELLNKHRMSAAGLSRRFHIPYRTIQNWCAEGKQHRDCPEYITEMMDEILSKEGLTEQADEV